MGQTHRHLALVLACAVAVGCTGEVALETETEIVQGCADFCWASAEATCDPDWYRQITSFEAEDRAACARLCQTFYDDGELTSVNEVGSTTCDAETRRYLICLSNSEACDFADGCAVEYASLRSCFRAWCSDNPDSCTGERPDR